jgi:hypothetical protein
MATTYDFPDIHTQAGARWLAPFLTVVVLTLLAVFAMMIYPHVTG